MTNSNSLNELNRLSDKKEKAEKVLKEINKEFIEVAKVAFKDWAVDLFGRYPNLKYITFTAYTPYFNDGDPTYYRSSHTYYSLNSEEAEEINEEGFDENELEKLKKEIDDFMTKFSDEDIEELFGDHCRVTITSHGVDVEEYDHS